MRNADLAALLRCCADHGSSHLCPLPIREGEKHEGARGALRALADEIAARPDPAPPLRLWVRPFATWDADKSSNPKYSLTIRADTMFSETCPGPDWREVALKD